MATDGEATELEQALAASAEAWHLRCARMGALYEQPVGQTVLEALVLYRQLLQLDCSCSNSSAHDSQTGREASGGPSDPEPVKSRAHT